MKETQVLSASTFVEGLIAPGPASEHRDALMLYGQFVGDWMTETRELMSDESWAKSPWDVRFED
jgi:hypothetical protein